MKNNYKGKIEKLYSILKISRDINHVLLKSDNEIEIFQKVCYLINKIKNIKSVWIGVVENKKPEIKLIAYSGFNSSSLSELTRYILEESKFFSDIVKTGKPFVVKDIEKQPLYKNWKKTALKMGFASTIFLPLICEKEIIGILTVYSGEKDYFGTIEKNFLIDVCEDLSLSIKTLKLEKEIEESFTNLKSMVDETVSAISLMSEKRDPYTSGHQQRVSKLASAIAKEMGISEERIKGMCVAALLHDIGKIAVPSEILTKPGKISANEFNIIKTHSEVGFEILKDIKFPWPVAQILLQHHERINGSGYPNGLTGKDILLEAKILAVADVVEAMCSDRPYRPALGIKKALEEITKNKGILYDPNVVDACLKLFEKGYQI